MTQDVHQKFSIVLETVTLYFISYRTFVTNFAALSSHAVVVTGEVAQGTLVSRLTVVNANPLLCHPVGH